MNDHNFIIWYILIQTFMIALNAFYKLAMPVYIYLFPTIIFFLFYILIPSLRFIFMFYILQKAFKTGNVKITREVKK